ncbi:Origin recognition complex subunit 2 [Exophiala oligosperma]
MAKRKHAEPSPSPEVAETPSKRRKKTTEASLTNGVHRDEDAAPSPKKQETPSRRKRKSAADLIQEEEDLENGSPTPKTNGRTLFSTPRRNKAGATTPSKSKADRSARRKSAQAIALAQDEDEDQDDWDGQAALAREILEDDDHERLVAADQPDGEGEGQEATTPTQTPSRGRGRPKGAKNKRSPTPEGNIPPEERYFFQNRAGPPQISSNKFTSVKLLTHEDYFENIQTFKDPHESHISHLMRLHTRSFAQWQFELSQGYGLCLYGYGSKRGLVNKFAEHMYTQPSLKGGTKPKIVIVNGYTPKLNIRHILNTVGSAITGEDSTLRLVGQPHEMLDTLFTHLGEPVVVMINSIDAAPLRRSGVQSVLARLAGHEMISFLATADSPSFATMWNSSLLDQFRFVYHDCTTFAGYDAEINVVDDVHELLGRKRTRIGGKEGVGFVLKSLPENARNLYKLLLSEILVMLAEGGGVGGSYGDDEDDAGPGSKRGRGGGGGGGGPNRAGVEGAGSADEVGVEYRVLYQKASTDFICSSSMNFQFLLKEFHDHQLITSRRDATGTEMLGVPLGRDEMEAVLEDLSG